MTSVGRREWIRLTKTEEKIFVLLLGAVRNFSPETKLRVAGGWVRDKLLGKESNDIDIAIENMLGSQFLVKLNDYLRSQGEEQVNGHVIENKGKQQLETVKMRLYGQDIDLVHLRTEEFAGNSRIPVKVDFATAEEDAHRRDLTINSLFYNIHTGLVEDFTGRGINDLRSGIIATPLHPRATFLDDPLRVLRAIRFAARFDFSLEKELRDVASSEEVRKALAEKISRERIGNEIDLMITGNRPVSAVTHLSDLKLFGLVFALPSSSQPAPSESLCRAYMEAMWNLIHTSEFKKISSEDIRHALYAALLLPYRKMVYKNNKGKLVPVVDYIFKVSLKQKSSDADAVVDIHHATGRFLSLIIPLQPKKDVQVDIREWGTDVCDLLKWVSQNGHELPAISKTRVLAGFLLRDIKALWRVSLLTSLLLCTDDQNDANLDFQLNKKRAIYLTIEGTIGQQLLDTIWNLKPLVDGNDISKALQLTNKGPIIREWQQKLLTWQLAYPKGMPIRQRWEKSKSI